MPIEIERKFLVDGDAVGAAAGVTTTRAWVIRQGYVTRPGVDPEVRVRHARPVEAGTALGDDPQPLAGPAGAEVRRLTTKARTAGGGGGAVSRHEVEVDLAGAAFEELWAITAERRIAKVRVEHRWSSGAHEPVVLTVDHFAGRLAGLRLAEVEFADGDASRAFERPACLGAEVTDDPRYRNAALAGADGPPPPGEAVAARPSGSATRSGPDPGSAPGFSSAPGGHGEPMGFKVAPDERLGDGLRRSACDQLDGALHALEHGIAGDAAGAIHDARKRLKKTRALLRLTRPALGRRVARRENGALREAAATLSAARDADVLVETVDALAERYAGRLPSATFDAARDAVSGPAVGSGTPSVDAAVEGIRAVRARADGWPLDDATTRDVLEGEAIAYAAGRDQLPEPGARPTAEELHDWRKRAKDLWYHGLLLQNSWSAVMRAQAEEAHHLSELLGDDHDLEVLRERLCAAPVEDPMADVDGVLELIERRRLELQAEALALGRRVYAETPKAHARRVRRYVEDWQGALPG